MFAAIKKVFYHPAFGGIAEEYLEDMRRKRSYRAARQRVGCLSALLPKRADRITARDIAAILDNMRARGYSDATLNHVRQTIKTIYNRARARGHNLPDPTIGIDPLPLNNERQGYLTPAECARLLEAVKRGRNKRLYLFAALLTATGARVGAVLTIRVSDCDLINNVINLNNYKAGRSYIGYITDHLRPLIAKAIEGLDPYKYLIGGKDRPCQRKATAEKLQRYLNRLFNIPRGIAKNDRKNKIVCHSLRHSFGTNLAMAGVSPFAIAQMMDHRSISQTQRYSKIADTRKREAVGDLMRSILNATSV
jgi:integrase